MDRNVALVLAWRKYTACSNQWPVGAAQLQMHYFIAIQTTQETALLQAMRAQVLFRCNKKSKTLQDSPSNRILDATKNPKLYKILYQIESCGTCMEY